LRLAIATAAALALLVPGVARARPPAVTWCGTDESAADRTPSLELASVRQVRFVYAVPADGVDNFATMASGIATDAAWIDEWWQKQDPTRSPRFDRYAFAGCSTKFGALDIGFQRLPKPGSFYAAGDQFRKLTIDLQDAFPIADKTIVYYDGPVADGNICGVSNSQAEYGGWAGIAYVYLGSDCALSPAGSGGSAEVAAHELLHDLGALDLGAPNACPDDDAHPCDSESDVLYPYLGDASTLDIVTLDVGHDDYYAHAGRWLDVQDSWWLTRFPQIPFSLIVSGKGTVTTTAGGGAPLPCSTGCTNLLLDTATDVTAIAIPARGWRIGTWEGLCTTRAGMCEGVVNGPMEAKVTFVPDTVDVHVEVRGRGVVTSAPKGITCSRSCTHTFAAGANVVLRAAPAHGWRFSGWNGACRGRGACRLSASDETVAVFIRR